MLIWGGIYLFSRHMNMSLFLIICLIVSFPRHACVVQILRKHYNTSPSRISKLHLSCSVYQQGLTVKL